MSPDTDASLNISLKEVRDRFDDSASTLAKAKEHLDTLAEVQSEQNSASKSLQEASQKLGGFTDSAQQAVASLDKAQQSAAQAFESLEAFVDGSDLRAVRDGVSEMLTRLDRVNQLETELSAAKTDLAKVSEDLARLKVAAGARNLKKAGLQA